MTLVASPTFDSSGAEDENTPAKSRFWWLGRTTEYSLYLLCFLAIALTVVYADKMRLVANFLFRHDHTSAIPVMFGRYTYDIPGGLVVQHDASLLPERTHLLLALDGKRGTAPTARQMVENLLKRPGSPIVFVTLRFAGGGPSLQEMYESRLGDISGNVPLERDGKILWFSSKSDHAIRYGLSKRPLSADTSEPVLFRCTPYSDREHQCVGLMRVHRLLLEYQFPESMLSDWETLEAQLTRLMQGAKQRD